MFKLEKRKFLWLVVLVSGSLLIILELVFWHNKQLNMLEVSFLDVGQGDATLISYLGKYQVLIDGGPNGRKLLEELGRQMPLMDKKIEVVVLTHPDFDHLAGLIDVVRNYEVRIFLSNGQEADTDTFQELSAALTAEKIKTETLLKGSKISIGKYLNFQVFSPAGARDSSQNRNENSVALGLDFGINSFLLMGDATSKNEKELINNQADLKADWLKVGHHGSKHSSAEEFLKAVSPRFAVISAGAENSYKHPAQAVLQRLDAVGSEILRTDQLETIKVVCERPQVQCSLETR